MNFARPLNLSGAVVFSPLKASGNRLEPVIRADGPIAPPTFPETVGGWHGGCGVRLRGN